ncbi:MAG: Asp-tRNA(Asn)/Glu-tRNA(Gln) amidotransferase subunit GatA [Arenicella sp.]
MTIHTLASLHKQLADKTISSTELVQQSLKHAEASTLNTFISITSDNAIEQAKAYDQTPNNTSPLAGIPIAHKDLFCTKGVLTSCGSKILENFTSPYDATVVENLNTAGSISIGKTNMDEFAMGSSNESSYYGAVDNPWDTDRVPGGSSGGSAAAVAAGLIPFATGSDTGGSVRQPAAYCNLTGVKPTYGRCSRYGMIAYASSLDQAGTFTHTAEDAAIALNAMIGFDKKDSTSLDAKSEDLSANLNDSIKGLRIGIPSEFFSKDLNAEVAELIENAIKEYEKMGASIVPVSLKNSALALPAYYIIAPAEASSNLSRFDGVRYGFRANDYKDLDDMYTKTRSEGFGTEVQKRIMVGAYALSSGYYDAYYAKAQKLRRLITNDYLAAFQSCDVILGPTTPEPAFKKGSTSDPVSMYLNDIYTVTANLSGLPAASIPAGFTKSGLPVGMQLTTPHLQEAKLLNIAHQYQQVTAWHTQTPECYTTLGGEA